MVHLNSTQGLQHVFGDGSCNIEIHSALQPTPAGDAVDLQDVGLVVLVTYDVYTGIVGSYHPGGPEAERF